MELTSSKLSLSAFIYPLPAVGSEKRIITILNCVMGNDLISAPALILEILISRKLTWRVLISRYTHPSTDSPAGVIMFIPHGGYRHVSRNLLNLVSDIALVEKFKIIESSPPFLDNRSLILPSAAMCLVAVENKTTAFFVIWGGQVRGYNVISLHTLFFWLRRHFYMVDSCTVAGVISV
ncbi:hypothetical protein F4781DRAFT_362139 [Annulohypoxylon bovei var. microspora]|nr:hypothetical protein F4781DRAFT_362139 [Annulohypoxylon bovei var. microspora]